MSNKGKSNIALLTEGADYIRRAKKARKEQVEEIKFDDEARREWLTGFSKRKKAKADEKRTRAKERDRQAHLEERRKARAELRQKAAENMKSVRRAMGLDDDDDDDDEDDEEPTAGPSNSGPSKVSAQAKEVEEAEYSDEDQLATVTIIEDFDPSSAPKPTFSRSSLSPDPEESTFNAPIQDKKKSVGKLPFLPPSSGKLAKAKEKKKTGIKDNSVKKVPKKSTSMETASERRKGREMEARRRTKKASLAMDREGKKRGLQKGGKGRGAARGKGRR
ncbi:ribosomal RNA-processing protein 17 [Kwoniella heveanensis CBS 569]|uniref:Ribosomal RNA-processing protein 17 n=1 Tax=Kwoniella heveanensis BCC8398 TaxID=1296120 RepID=A0A1B9H001_9TREE|nr:ribosomal RNA-processing protein 17 [Kwoniella heveanensis BCC8398]OCF45421.1 ribosomal RNA-processing protein 17 [Kwoniella heveanensis CBS 569]